MKYPKISIIVCAYKQEEIIEDTLKHHLKLSYPNKEIVAAIDTEEDKTYEKAKKFKNKIKITFSKNRRGIVNAFNDALKIATGKIIVKFDAEYRFCIRNPLKKIAKYYENPKVMALTFHIIDPPNRLRNFGRLAIAQATAVKIVNDWRKEKYPIVKGFFPMPIFVHSFRNVFKNINISSINDDAEFAYKILKKEYEIRFADNIKFYALQEPNKPKDVFYRQRRTTTGWFETKKRRNIMLKFYYFSLLKFYLSNIRRYGLYNFVCLCYFILIYSISVFGAFLNLKQNINITRIWVKK